MQAMSLLPPKSKQDRFWHGCRLFSAATRDDAILCGLYARQHDESLSAESKCERLEQIVDSAFRLAEPYTPAECCW
jgi:hypothetical protein